MVNAEELAAAEGERFDVVVTTDTKMKYQQNLASRNVAVVVLSTTSWPRIEAAVELVVAAVSAASPGSYTEVRIP